MDQYIWQTETHSYTASSLSFVAISQQQQQKINFPPNSAWMSALKP